MILDGVVSSAVQILGDLGPAIPQQSVGQEQHPLLKLTPFLLLDLRVQVIVPTLTTLLPDST